MSARYPFGDKEAYKQRYTSAAERSKYPILDMLSKYIPEQGKALEIASGLGQHVSYFAEKLPKWKFLPTDIDDENLQQLRQRVSSIPNIEDPVWLDAAQEDWGVVEKSAPFDLIIAINCIHVSPRALHVELFKKSKQLLNSGGWLFIYAACKIDGEYTSESNKNFDEMLRSTHPEVIFRLEAVPIDTSQHEYLVWLT
ncbi:hypothetical protein GAYE_SCF16G3615 [Galdieria yellowstonensis]|uniref:Methyltransferase type 12 domain-containing protein n=1 Tax=Galdieria yellowstonensis TaxID=3028027 RepID=A0AAV9IEM6_9RHOD|nr:hypothetical protein GAYE_SCF16G3615 [Galdieria yellowstonensis]